MQFPRDGALIGSRGVPTGPGDKDIGNLSNVLCPLFARQIHLGVNEQWICKIAVIWKLSIDVPLVGP